MKIGSFATGLAGVVGALFIVYATVAMWGIIYKEVRDDIVERVNAKQCDGQQKGE